MSSVTTTHRVKKTTSNLAGLEYYSFRDYRRLLARRKWTVVTVALTIALGVSIWAHLSPNIYQASTQIVVDPGKVPESYVRSTATIAANERLAILEEQILSTTKLGQVIDEFGLYHSLKATKTEDDIVALMKKKITVESTTTAPPARALKTFTVSFTAQSPAIAAKVANRLASLFIEENLKVREQQVAGTADFFDHELEKAKQDLDEQAQKLERLRVRYSADLPESQNLHLQALTAAQLAMQGEADTVSRAKDQRVSLQSLLASSPNVVNLDNGGGTAGNGLQEQLERLKGEMGQLRSHYGPSYPDVLNKEAEINNVEQKISDLQKQGMLEAATSGRVHNPAIENQIAQLTEEIRKHEAHEAELQSQVKFHESFIQRVPGAQQELAAASNDLAMASDRYKRLEDHKFGADMFSEVEARQQGERFVLLEPAQPPEHPVEPNRLLIDAVGAVAGLGIALLLVLALELLDSTVKTARELRERLMAPILGEIPPLTTKSRKRRERLGAILAATGNLALAVAYVSFLAAALK